ncbi:MAG: CoA transferase [Gordonia sp. (in: high G+C Gram-positive bacteria)]|uniref:CaiB/BaiF CoA transferase family protein n=1 Tax=Gordonia sp. (in: high G+C Gram-positive bacteria) TaxID=84139 RepID=UPI0039E24412
MTATSGEDPVEHRPLEGVRVLDLTVALSGPYATLILVALGAEVIKIESPGGSDISRFNPPFATPSGELHLGGMEPGDVSLSVLARTRGKKSVELDLKSAAGRDVFYRLARNSDAVVENLSDGVVDRLGVDYETLREINPALIYCSLNGLGRPSAFPGTKAMDVIVQALSGAMDATGETDGPPLRFGLPIADLLAPLYTVIGLQAALLSRRDTGRGQRVDVSMLEALASLLPFEHGDVLRRHGFPARSGNHHDRLAPFGVYRTSDGHVALTGASDSWTAEIFAAMGVPELAVDPRFASRGPRAANAAVLNTMIEDWTAQRTTAEVLERLGTERGVPCVRVRTGAEVLDDEDLAERGVIGALPGLTGEPLEAKAAGIPIRMSATPVVLDQPAHPLGADTEDVLRTVAGLDDDELAALRAVEAI